jgi:sirohydrochlorin cobaltochelatase
MTLGYLLVGHGTRKAAGQDQFRTVYAQFESLMKPHPSALAFLELAEPDIPTAIANLAAQGVSRLVTVPVLLFSAGHAQRDIPEAVEAAAAIWEIQIERQVPAFECSPPVLALSALRFREAVCFAGSLSDESPACGGKCLGHVCSQAGLVMLGRGSNSTSATEEMRRFTELRVEQTHVAWHQTGFIHAQQPSVAAALDELASSEHPVAVVQPHLLFEGELIDSLRAEVARRQALQPQKRWFITDTLGTDSSLAKTLATLAKCESSSTKVGEA